MHAQEYRLFLVHCDYKSLDLLPATLKDVILCTAHTETHAKENWNHAHAWEVDLTVVDPVESWSIGS